MAKISWGVQISGSKTALGQIFKKKIFWPRKKFRTLFPEKIGKKSSKNCQKWHFWDLKGDFTCVLQVKITLFYFKMVNSVMILQFWAPKIIFCCDFRPISDSRHQKIVFWGSRNSIWGQKGQILWATSWIGPFEVY